MLNYRLLYFSKDFVQYDSVFDVKQSFYHRLLLMNVGYAIAYGLVSRINC